jgi:hypothetical protein
MGTKLGVGGSHPKQNIFFNMCWRSKFFKLEILWSPMHIPHGFMCSLMDSLKLGQLVGETHLVLFAITNLEHLFHLGDIYPQCWLHDYHNNHATHRSVHLGLPRWGNVVPLYNIHSFEFCLVMDLLDGTIT